MEGSKDILKKMQTFPTKYVFEDVTHAFPLIPSIHISTVLENGEEVIFEPTKSSNIIIYGFPYRDSIVQYYAEKMHDGKWIDLESEVAPDLPEDLLDQAIEYFESLDRRAQATTTQD